MNHRISIWASLVLLLVSVVSCQRSGIEVVVSGLPTESKSLLVSASLRNRPTAQLIQAVNGRLDSFWVEVPSGDDYLTVTVGALGETGCRIAEGTAADVAVPTDRVEVALSVLDRPGCSVRVDLVGDGKGRIVSEPTGIDCPGSCTAAFEPGTTVKLRAIPEADVAFFAGWSQSCSGIGECRLRITDAPLVVQAGFLPSSVCRGSFCWESPLPQGNSLRALFVRAEDDAWAVGGSGTILHWIGAAWAPVRSGTSADLWGVFGRGDKLWVVGDGGTILYYDGTAFVPVQSPTKQNLRAVSGNETEIYIAGESGTLLRGTGASFVALPTSISVALRGLSVSASEVWAVGDSGTAVRYRSGQLTLVPTGTSESLAAVTERSAGDVWLAGDKGTLLRWNGSAFAKQSFPSLQNLRSLWSSKEGELWCAADAGALFRYSGKAWTSTGSGVTQNLLSVHGSSSGTAWATGDAGVILRWNGAVWTPVQGQNTEPLLAIGSMDKATLITIGASGRIRQRVAGVWHVINSGPGPTISSAWIGEGEVWAVSGNLLFRWGKIGADPRLRWLTFSLAPFTLTSVGRRSYDPAGLFVFALVTSLDGAFMSFAGTLSAPNYTPQTVSAAPLRGITGVSATDGWMVGDGGVAILLKGNTPMLTVTGTSRHLLGVYGLSASDVWAVGEGGTIIHWDGAGWSKMDSGTNQNLRGVWASAPNDVWVVGDRGTVLFYDGKKFSSVSTETSNSLFSIVGSSVTGATDGSLFTVGENSTVLHGGRTRYP